MRGIRINFSGETPTFDMEESVTALNATVQNALVNVGTDRGSDQFFPERGTDLKKDGVAGKMASVAWSNHSANFAALRTLAFSQLTELSYNPWKMRAFNLKCTGLDGATVKLNVTAVSGQGQTVGREANI